MALLLELVTQKGRSQLPFTPQANTNYVFRQPDQPLNGSFFLGTMEFTRLHQPTGEWTQISSFGIWVRSHTFRVDALNTGGNRFWFTCRHTGYILEIHNFV